MQCEACKKRIKIKPKVKLKVKLIVMGSRDSGIASCDGDMDVLKWWFVAWDSWAKTKARDRELTAFPSASTALQTKSGLDQSKS